MPVRTSGSGSVVLLTLGFVLVGLCAVATTAAVLLSTGPTAFAVGLLFAVVPVAPLLLYFRWLDRYEPEPFGLAVFAFGWGAAVATFGALVINSTSVLVLDAAGGDGEFVGAVVVAPLVEEGLKGLGLLAIVLIGRRGLDSLVDGVVYAGVIGVGFAFVENILYLGGALLDGGGQALIATFVVRGLLSPFAHPLFTSAFGIGLALAARHRGIGRLSVLVGYAVAVALHATWNYTASLPLDSFVGAFVAIHVPLFALYVTVGLLSRAREGRLIRRHLQTYAAVGWLTPAELQMLGDLRLRRHALADAGRGAAAGQGRAGMRRFQEAAVSLAHLRNRMATGSAPRDAQVLERRMLETISANRPISSRVG